MQSIETQSVALRDQGCALVDMRVMGMKHVLFILSFIVLAGCQSQKATVIAPDATQTGKPKIEWVQRDNVLYLQLSITE